MPDSGAARRSRGRPEEIKFDFDNDEESIDKGRRTPPGARPAAARQMSAPDPVDVVSFGPARLDWVPPGVPSTPAVIAKRREPSGVEAPELVFAPAYPNTEGGQQKVMFDLRRSATGEIAAIAFSTPRALVDALGRCQPWMAVSTAKFRQFMRAAGVETVLLDPHIDPSAPRITLARLEQFVGEH